MNSEKNLEPDHDMMGKDALMTIFCEADSSVVQELALRLIRTEKELLTMRKAFSDPVAFKNNYTGRLWHPEQQPGAAEDKVVYTPLYARPE